MNAMAPTKDQRTEARLHDAAERFASILNMGLIDFSEAVDALMGQAVKSGYNLNDLDVLYARLCKTITTHALSAELYASQTIRDGVRPLIARRAKSAEIVGAAVTIGYHALPPNQCRDIALEEIAAALYIIKERRRA